MKRLLPRARHVSVVKSTLEHEASGSAAPGKRRRLPRTFSSLRHRNYRLYLFGQLISLMGTFMQTVAQAWLVLQLTNSAFQLGLVGALQFLPVLLFSIFGGVVADRWPKRRILLFTQSAAMLQALLLWGLAATGNITLWQIDVLAVALGFTSTIDAPTRSAFIAEMTGREDLPNAIALSSSLMNLARVAGPALGGVLIAVAGVGPLFLINGVSFLAVLVALVLIRTDELHVQAGQAHEERKRQSTWQSLREGLAYVWTTPSIALVISVVGVVLLLGANFNVVLPLFATDVLHEGATGFGFLSGAMGTGALLAALWLAWSQMKPTVPAVLISTLVFSLLEVAFSLSPVYLASLALIAGVGGMESIFAALAITTLQTEAPDHLRGRVNSVYIFFFSGSVPVGYVMAGWLSALLGAPLGLLLCAVLCLATVGVGWVWWMRTRQRHSGSGGRSNSSR